MDTRVRLFTWVWTGLVVMIGLPPLLRRCAVKLRRSLGEPSSATGARCMDFLLPTFSQLIGKRKEPYLREFTETTLIARPENLRP
jgi:hypothetical protein